MINPTILKEMRKKKTNQTNFGKQYINWILKTRLPRPWDFPGKSTGVGCDFLLQGIFPTQG